MQNPYEVLGIQPTATDDEVKAAYRELAKKYHPDNYTNNPLSDLAEEKMQEINEAYDAIIRLRRQGGSANGNPGYQEGVASRYADIRNLIRTGRNVDAEALLDGIPAPSRDAEWYFLKGSVLYKKGWLEEAYSHISTAVRMDPTNAEYQQAMNRLEMQRRTGGYRVSPMSNGGNDACRICNTLLCADCCCECMGGDLIPCC